MRKRILKKAFYIIAPVLLTSGCGHNGKTPAPETPTTKKVQTMAQQNNSWQTPTPTPTPKPVESKITVAPFTAINFNAPVPMPFSTKYTPFYEIPCGPTVAGTWNYQCETVLRRTQMCQPMTDTCAQFEPLLRKADAVKRTNWVAKCFNTFESVITNMKIAAGTQTAGGHLCPQYPVLGYVDGNGKPHLWSAPIDDKASCDRPTNVFPVLFCTSHLQ